MTDLIAFLAARLDEDEASAARAQSLRDKLGDPRRQIDPAVRDGAEHAWQETGIDPGRMLREVEAKRAIVRRCAGVMNEMDQYPNGLVSPRALLARQTLMWLAVIWSDHPDYDQEWKP